MKPSKTQPKKQTKKSKAPKDSAKDQTVKAPDNNTDNGRIRKLPKTIAARVALALKIETGPQRQRILRYALNHPGCYTMQISQNCAVGFPPNRIEELNKGVLARFGLHLLCYKPEVWLKNRYGEDSHTHQWRLVMV